MLLKLSVKNFAIIEDIDISFKDGLTVLTGETGAGKSLILIELLVDEITLVIVIVLSLYSTFNLSNKDDK